MKICKLCFAIFWFFEHWQDLSNFEKTKNKKKWKSDEKVMKNYEKLTKLWKSVKKCEKVGKYIYFLKNYEKVASFSVKKWKTWKTRLLHMGQIMIYSVKNLF